MQRIVYNGPHPEAYVIHDGDVAVEDVRPGEPIDVPDELADRLLEQSTWSIATTQAPAVVVARPTAPAPAKTGA